MGVRGAACVSAGTGRASTRATLFASVYVLVCITCVSVRLVLRTYLAWWSLWPSPSRQLP